MGLLDLHNLLILLSCKSWTTAAKHYNQVVSEPNYKERDRVLLGDMELLTNRENKVMRLWIGLYIVAGILGNVGRLLKLEIKNCLNRVHIIRPEKISNLTVEKCNPKY